MVDQSPEEAPSAEPPRQPERSDFADLGAPGRARSQPLAGFDPGYADIVDYILRCTHRIWEEKDVGLIYTHYTHNCVVYTPTEILYDREQVVESTIRRIVTMPDVGKATHVIWGGDERDGFYTSHLITTTGRHTQPGPYGAPTGLPFSSRTVADCMIWRNRIYREWLVGDPMAVIRQLGLDPAPIAEQAARAMLAEGRSLADLGERPRLRGQYPPETEPDLSLAHDELEADTLRWMHAAFNRRMFGSLRAVYAPTALWHGPLMEELVGVDAVIHRWMGLFGVIPDGSFAPQHICSTPSGESGTKIAVRWLIDGRHGGWGPMRSLGAPTGAPLRVMGISHFHHRDGRIVDEWTLWDELSLLTQIKAWQIARQGGAGGGDAA